MFSFPASMGDDNLGCVVRVRGLPWSASQEEIANFFEGMHGLVFASP